MVENKNIEGLTTLKHVEIEVNHNYEPPPTHQYTLEEFYDESAYRNKNFKGNWFNPENILK